jgi:hypothetical protein
MSSLKEKGLAEETKIPESPGPFYLPFQVEHKKAAMRQKDQPMK